MFRMTSITAAAFVSVLALSVGTGALAQSSPTQSNSSQSAPSASQNVGTAAGQDKKDPNASSAAGTAGSYVAPSGYPANSTVAAQPLGPGEKPVLEKVAELNDRPANVAVTMQGIVYVTLHPVDSPKIKVLQINPRTGDSTMFPSEEWNSATNNDEVGIAGAIGIRATLSATLTVLDMGDAKHSPRIIEFNPFSQMVGGITYIPQNVLTTQSFLQDYAVDWVNNYFFIADMGQADPTLPAQPAIIAVNRSSNWIRRVLVGFPGLMPPDKDMVAEGKKVEVKNALGKYVPVRLGLNPITIDPQNDWLYFGPMGAGKLYRVPISKLVNSQVTPEEQIKSVEVVGDKPECDGITVDSAGNVYITNVRDSEIGVIGKDGKYKSFLKDPRLVWADGLSFGPDGYIYVAISQLNHSAKFGGGKDSSHKPYLIAKFRPLAAGVVGR